MSYLFSICAEGSNLFCTSIIDGTSSELKTPVKKKNIRENFAIARNMKYGNRLPEKVR